jgi:hypothetical protein
MRMTKSRGAVISDMKGKVMASAAIAMAVREAAQEINRTVEALDRLNLVELDGISTEMADEMRKVITWAKAAQDPIRALTDWLHGGSVEEAVADANAALEGLVQQREAKMKRYFATLDAEEAAINRLIKLHQSARDLEVARQSAAVDKAVSAGASSEGGAALKLDASIKNRIAGIDDTITKAAAALEELQGKADYLESAAKKMKLNDPGRDKAVADSQAMAAEVTKSTLDLQTLIETSNNQQQALIEQGTTAIDDIGRKGQAAFAAEVSRMIAETKESITRSGQAYTATEKSNFEELQRMISDKVDDSKQMDRFKVLIDNLHASRIMTDSAANDALERVVTAWQAQMKVINPLITEKARLKQEQINQAARISSMGLR